MAGYLSVLISGQKVSLRRSDPTDAARAYEWFALSEVTPLLRGPPLYPELPIPDRATFDRTYPAHFFDGTRPFSGRALIISNETGDIGVLAHGTVRPLHGTVEIELWLNAKRWFGRGYGSEALRLACAWLQENVGVDRFALRPSRRNVRALRAFRRAGFRSIPIESKETLRRLGLFPSSFGDAELLLLSLPPPPMTLLVEPDRTYVFLDSEFTDFFDPQLISIGAATNDGNAFYCEIADWPRERASAFVLQTVAPLLDGQAVPQAKAARSFANWLAQRAAQRPVTLVTDSGFDRWALAELLGGEGLPAGIRWQRVPLPYDQLDAVIDAIGLRRHHALDDARGLRHALLHPGGTTTNGNAPTIDFEQQADKPAA